MLIQDNRSIPYILQILPNRAMFNKVQVRVRFIINDENSTG